MVNDTRREKTKRAIEAAMITLLKDQSFNEISTINLTKTAGISRSSFYTHYKDKYEMIDQYQQSLFNKVEYIFDRNQFKKEDALLEIFQFLDRESLFAALLTQNGTKEIQTYILNKLQLMLSKELPVVNPDATKSDINRLYYSVYLSHAIFGVYQMWITRGKKESPQQITQVLLSLLPQT
ncbi:TPA: TetR/AcrR family transcriptional regulator [Streptococcus agalactiae]|uniref:TetR/AcrR family transcriptional regulator n=1 Tax=Streptococcus agalactiae TaxID=1311 RepID=UPI002AC1BD47|nr:TetR/AcrR family transcriptional regulator C-terminal domain-containing protein [Streptococcus agalactiae]HEN8983701.1 TetR/AcrR family transcriptional regulator C-terminal domain-containing protein [Streptococcus agalactiae]HEN9275401.1 TetR/AcrR family transcriptional regulator C-terminal domain-containing protein [Streptococcus agalactiae]HEO2148027.1 TetR/AcrR family transcriptional regulator C-terminal domain-containing protein [Streptococcus agalactiae]HEO3709315.1 TetR/AcrR family tra